jgi:hypothetical protein
VREALGIVRPPAGGRGTIPTQVADFEPPFEKGGSPVRGSASCRYARRGRLLRFSVISARIFASAKIRRSSASEPRLATSEASSLALEGIYAPPSRARKSLRQALRTREGSDLITL